jgi:prepilin-type processing-associated H-X9-DG protein/prepilin-type N-terminal cleavage/methylation domain-containing protein
VRTLPSHSHTAFTLTELLVVIAILGILAALISAATLHAKKRAHEAQCANNVRQLGTGLHLFTAEFSVYPLLVNPDYSKGAYPEHQHSWTGAIESELSKHNMIQYRPAKEFEVPYPPLGVWHCPAADRPSGLRRNEGFADYGYNVYGVGAVTQQTALGLGGHYVWASTQSTSRLPGPPVKESEVASPSEMMAIADGFHGGSGVVRDGAGWLMRDSSTQDNVGSTKRAYARHDGKANVVFCDGHVESPKLPFLFEDMSDAALVRWNRDHQPHRDRL